MNNCRDCSCVRVNAGEVTERLVLWQCHKIQGWGLGPLQYSCLLTHVDLAGSNCRDQPPPTTPTRNSDGRPVWCLFRLAAYEPRRHKEVFSRIYSSIHVFWSDLQQAMLERTHAACSCCQLPVLPIVAGSSVPFKVSGLQQVLLAVKVKAV